MKTFISYRVQNTSMFLDSESGALTYHKFKLRILFCFVWGGESWI